MVYASFDLWNLLVNELAGGIIVFIVLSIIAIMYFTMRFNLPYEIGMLLGIIFSGIIFANDPDTFLLWLIVLIIVSVVFYLSFRRKVE
jgi:uncharacterized membrane protein YfcA